MFAGAFKDGRFGTVGRLGIAGAALLAVAGTAFGAPERDRPQREDRTVNGLNKGAQVGERAARTPAAALGSGGGGRDSGGDRNSGRGGRDNDRGVDRGPGGQGGQGSWDRDGRGNDRHDDRHDHSDKSKVSVGVSINVGSPYANSASIGFGYSNSDMWRRGHSHQPVCPPVVIAPACPPVVIARPCPPRVVYATPAPVVITRPVVVERPIVIERPVIVERRVIVTQTTQAGATYQDRELGDAYLRMGDFENAARVTERYLSAWGGDGVATRNLGLARLGVGNVQEGLRGVAQGYALETAMFQRPLTHADLGGEQACERLLDAAARGAISTNAAEAWFTVALLQHASGNRDAALVSVQKARNAGLVNTLFDPLTLMVSRQNV